MPATGQGPGAPAPHALPDQRPAAHRVQLTADRRAHREVRPGSNHPSGERK